MLNEMLPIAIPAIIGLGIGLLIGRCCRLKKAKWLLGFITAVMCTFLSLHLAKDIVLPFNLRGAVDQIMPEGIQEEEEKPKPLIDFGLHPLGVTSITFRERFNQIVDDRFPQNKQYLKLPALEIETNLLNNSFRHSVTPDITISGGIQKQNDQIDEITIIAYKDIAPEAFPDINYLAIAATETLLPESIHIDHEINAILIEAINQPYVQIERFVGDIRLTAMMDSLVCFIFTISRPVSYPTLETTLEFYEGEQ